MLSEFKIEFPSGGFIIVLDMQEEYFASLLYTYGKGWTRENTSMRELNNLRQQMRKMVEYNGNDGYYEVYAIGRAFPRVDQLGDISMLSRRLNAIAFNVRVVQLHPNGSPASISANNKLIPMLVPGRLTESLRVWMLDQGIEMRRAIVDPM
jgi:hypothetical protein